MGLGASLFRLAAIKSGRSFANSSENRSYLDGKVVEKIDTVKVSANQIAEMINRYFIADASEEDINALKKVINGGSFNNHHIKSKNGNQTLLVYKKSLLSRVFNLHPHSIKLFEDSVDKRRTVYFYTKFSYKEFSNAINAYLDPNLSSLIVNRGVPKIHQEMASQAVNSKSVMSEEKFKCMSCGAEINKGTKFCPECGSPTERHCPKCNAVIAGTPKFCPECGEKL